MPTYQYTCTSCGEPLEVVQKFTDDPLTECPSCSGRLRKVFSAVGVVFKGSGFYRNDSRNSSTSTSVPAKEAKNGEAKSDTNGTAKESKSTDAKSDPKPKSDSKSDSKAPAAAS